MKHLTIIIFFVSYLLGSCVHAQENINGNVHKVSKPDDPELRLKSIESKLDIITNSIEVKFQKYAELNEELQTTVTNLNEVNSTISKLSLNWTQASSKTRLGAVILLCGLFIEIIGATLLAGTHLISRQEDVFTLNATPPSLDLSMNDVNKEPRINFLGTLASVLLFIGFVFQFTGTVLILSLPTWMSILIVSLSIVPSLLIIYYLLGQSYNQTRTEKLNLVIKNIRRNLFPAFGLKCDFCSNKINISTAQIWWIQESNSEAHPYLHVPCYLHIGHNECLEKSEEYKIENNNTESHDMEIIKVSIKDFISIKIPELKLWWEEYRQHWAEKRGKDTTLCNQEYEFIQLTKRVAKSA